MSESIQELLADHPVIVEFPIHWGDMDAFQHVNNVMYFRYFETVRMACFDKLGFDDVMKKTGIGPILKSTQCQFKIPLTYPDTLSVGAKITAVQEDRFTTIYRAVSHQHQKVAAIGEGVIVSYDYKNNQKAPFPAEVYERIVSLQE